MDKGFPVPFIQDADIFQSSKGPLQIKYPGTLNSFLATFTLTSSIVILTFLLVEFIYKTRFSKLAKAVNNFPGGRILPLLGNIHQLLGKPEDVQNNISSYFAKHGKIARLWMFSGAKIFVSDYRVCEKILSSSTLINKGSDYKKLSDLMGNSLLVTNGQRWHTDRKLLNPSFNRQLFNGFLQVFNREGSLLTQLVRDQISENGRNQPDIYNMLTITMMGSAFECSMGIELNAQQDGENGTYAKALYNIVRCTRTRFLEPWIFNPFIYRFTQTAKDEAKAKATIENSVKLAIQVRKEGRKRTLSNSTNKQEVSGRTKPFIDLLLDLEPPMSERDMVDMLNGIPAAASHSTALSILFTLFYLALNPVYLKKAYEEIDSVFPTTEGEANVEAVTLDHLSKTKFLEMCWKEALRIRPPTPMIARSLTENLEVDEKILPKGADVVISIYDLHHDSEVYPQPDTFNPYRFTLENIALRSSYSYAPFSLGIRNCIGHRFAKLEATVTLIHILRRFQVSTPQKEEDVKVIIGMNMEPHPQIKLIFKERFMKST